MVKDLQSEFQILDTLKKQGFSEEIISIAMERANTKCIEDVLDYIEQLQHQRQKDPEFASKEKMLDEEIKKRREESIQDKLRLKDIRRRIKEDQIEREMTQKQVAEDPDIVKSEEIINFGECTVKVRSGGKITILHFKKSDTTSVLLKKVAEALSIKKFKLFLVNPHSEIVESAVTLEEIGLVPTGVVVVCK